MVRGEPKKLHAWHSREIARAPIGSGGRRVSRKVSNRSDGRAVYLHMGRWTEVKAWGQVSELHCVDRRGSDESCPPFSRTEIEQMLYKGRSAAARSGWSDYLKEADVFRGDV